MTHETAMKSRSNTKLVRIVHLESKSAGGVKVRRYELSKHGRELLTADVEELPDGKAEIRKLHLRDRIFRFLISAG